jgi:beta-glucanase (GH16 family)
MTLRALTILCTPLFLVGASCINPNEPGPYVLVWEDDFNAAAGTMPNAANWKYDVGTDWGNAQLEWTTDSRPENVSHDGAGNLVITARAESFNGRNYTSARITTAGKREFTYGRFEARIKLPIGQGIWPAFWMLGANINEVGWPRTGEIDIMEYRGQEPRFNHGSIHGPGYSAGNAITRRYTHPTGLNEDFNVYRVDWEPSQIRWYVNDSLFHLVNRGDQRGDWVFNHDFYLILNIAVGGGFVGPVGPGTTFPQQMLVDWVRVSQRQP